jgi:2-keto-4-pentenoate hydratase/2-oxohepta-3-ene-1,7-dioic acid hydratase in catechol pathway
VAPDYTDARRGRNGAATAPTNATKAEATMFKLATIEIKGAPRVALALGDTLYDVESLVAAHKRKAGKAGKAALASVPRPVTMLGLLERWPAAFRDLQRLATFVEAQPRAVPGVAAARAKFRAPILYPPRIFTAGANYNAHSKEMTDILRPGSPYTTRENSNPAFLSQTMTLLPGDVLSTGTPSGVGFGRGVFLQPGDVVRVEIEGIGTLENPVA